MVGGLRLVLEDARKGYGTRGLEEVDLGACRFVEVQGGWITAWGGEDEMPVELWLFSFDEVGESVYAWPADGDIEKSNWVWVARRLNILSQKEEA
jgi:hypothetical protein